MLALYRSGRQADALEVYRSTRKTLVDKLGIEPGPALRRLETAILLQDPALELSRAIDASSFIKGSQTSLGQGTPALVGREVELAYLRQAFESCRGRSSCHLVTVLGSPGIGKTRLADELINETRITSLGVVGRCSPREEGASFWALAEIVEQLVGDVTTEAISNLLAEDPRSELVADRIVRAFGRGPSRPAKEDVFWAFRTMLETAAARRPLVIIIDDIHWASEALLDFVSYLADWSRNSAILSVCLARPELLDRRPAWGGGGVSSSVITLEPLTNDEAEVMLALQPGFDQLGTADRARVVKLAEGNPLFVEQITALAQENKPGQTLEMPSNLHAIVKARLENISERDRILLTTAAVIGRDFWLGLLTALLPEPSKGQIVAALRRLVRRDLIQPDQSTIPGEQGFRFRHRLTRDIAYELVTIKSRAALHEHIACWMEERLLGAVPEIEEVIGYHLERAFVLWQETGELTPTRGGLRDRAVRALSTLQLRELGQSGVASRVAALHRAAALLPRSDPLRVEILVSIAADLEQTGDWLAVEDLYTEALQSLDDDVQSDAAAFVAVLRDLARLQAGAPVSRVKTLRRAVEASGSLRARGRTGDAARLDTAVAGMHLSQGHAARAERSLRKVLTADEQANDSRAINVSRRLLAAVWLWGPTPVREAIANCEKVLGP